MPHFGQVPGWSDSTPGHMGQKYLLAGLRSAAAASVWAVEWWSPPWQQECSSVVGVFISGSG